MRFYYLPALLSLAVLGSAIAIPKQSAPTTETVYKNIKSFKGLPASDLVPAMQFMCASLKVECTYCHTADWSSDDKPEKGRAREMIAMQRDINARNFNGRNQVTCATCHAGHVHPQNVPPLTGPEIRARRGKEIETSEILSAYGKAVGAAPSAGSGFQLEGTSSSPQGKSPVTATFSGNRFTFVLKDAKQAQRQGFNGTMAWFSTPTGIQQVPLQIANSYVKQSSLFTGPDSLPKLSEPFGGSAKDGDRDLLEISGTVDGEKTRAFFFFDKKTGLLIRSQFNYPTTLGNIVQTNDYSDFRSVGGVMIPMTVTNHTGDGDTTMHFTAARAEAHVDQSRFDPPTK